MKYLHNFDTIAEYEAVKDTLEMPYIVSIDETDGLQYNTEVIRVPQGSEGGGESGGSNYIYYDQKRAVMNIKFLWEASSTIKVSMGGQTMIAHTIEVRDVIKENDLEESIIAVCIDPNIKFQTQPTDPFLTIFDQDSQALEWVNEVRITEEEYFNLNA